MAIKGWITKVLIPRVGKIHLGVKISNDGKEYPRAVDYLVVKPDDSTSENMAESFRSVYGDKPKELTIAFPSDDPEDFFTQDLASYRKVGNKPDLFCKGDGATASRARGDGQSGRMEIPCLYENCEIYVEGKCKELTRLRFFLPDVPGVGLWQIDSTSVHTTKNLMASIAMILSLTGGRIRMIPLKLRIKPHVASVGGRPKTVYVLDIPIEDVKLADFIQSVPLLPPLAPRLEAMDRNEMPEDLYTDSSMVTNEPEDASAFSAVRDSVPDPASTARQEPAKDPVAVLIDIDVQRDRQQRLIGKVRMANRQGEMIEALTDNAQVIETIKAWSQGTAFTVVLEDSARWRNRKEIVELRAIS